MKLSAAEQKMLTLAETLRVELNDIRLCDDDGTPLQAIADPLPAVAFVDAEQKLRAQLCPPRVFPEQAGRFRPAFARQGLHGRIRQVHRQPVDPARLSRTARLGP